jgi:hypothetical protein
MVGQREGIALSKQSVFRTEGRGLQNYKFPLSIKSISIFSVSVRVLDVKVLKSAP